MAIILPDKKRTTLDICPVTPNPAGSVTFDSNLSYIPVIGTTDYITVSGTSITKYNSSGASQWVVNASTYGMSTAVSAIGIYSGILYAFGYNTTGTLVGWIEITISTGAVTDKFASETYSEAPHTTISFSSLFVTGTELIAYSNGTKYVFNLSTGAKTSETMLKPTTVGAWQAPIDTNDSLGVSSSHTTSTSSGASFIYFVDYTIPARTSTAIQVPTGGIPFVTSGYCIVDDLYIIPVSSGGTVYGPRYTYLKDLQRWFAEANEIYFGV